MDTNLTATARTEAGKGAARKVRAAGQLPAVIYGPDYAPKNIALDPVAFDTIFRVTRDPNTVLHVELDGQTVPTLVRDVQRHPLSRELLHVDLLHVTQERKVTVPVRVEAKGRPAGASLGGRVRIIRRTLNVTCAFNAIPEKLYIDVSPMHIGDMRRASEIEMPEGVELVVESDINIVTVYGKKGGGKKS